MAAPIKINGAEPLLSLEKHPQIIASKKKTSKGSLKLIYIQCYFVTIATILGTGILGLPVTLSRAGLYPFLVSFIIGFFMQGLLICIFTDLLQRTYAVQLIRREHDEMIPLTEIDLDDDSFSDAEEENENSGPVLAGHVIIPKDIGVKEPNLHLMGQLFLGCGVRQLFDLVLIVQFISLLISYTLAGSEAYAQVIGVPYLYVIPVFCGLLTMAIVFALNLIQPVVSILTLAKGTLLLGTVIVTFYVGAEIHHEITNDFMYTGAPFLMGTVALGGIINVMPFLYSKIGQNPQQVQSFRFAIIMGLLTCTVLNVLWCWAVLDIVPQLDAVTCVKGSLPGNHSKILFTNPSKPDMVCLQNISLGRSAANGEISTIPLTQMIQNLYPAYTWVAFLVELFIMVSITVSYLTIGAAMHHTLKGLVESMWSSQDRFTSYMSKIKVAASRCRKCTTQFLCSTFLSLVAFSVVFAIAMLNPKGFVDMLEKVASSVINIEAGLFVFLMLLKARNSQNRRALIPLPLPNWVYYLQVLLPIYFCFAVVYDVFNAIVDILARYGISIWPPGAGHSEIINGTVFQNYSGITDPAVTLPTNILKNTTGRNLGDLVSTTMTMVVQNTTGVIQNVSAVIRDVKIEQDGNG
ncbi:uncharacterized protein LOC135494407 [Lineus longissimus]|uniref:uncharacterized protein LOC135494407 n=1 Tax=Lineus longissimus TaxID=88925 RepID=UPI002B4D3479